MDPLQTLSLANKLIYSANLLFDILGIYLFTVLVVATIKHKKLHTNCNLLIGIYGFCCLLSKLMILVPYSLTMFFPSVFIPLYICAILEFIPIFGLFNIFSLMLVIANDRMLSIFFPIWYTKRNNKFYLPLMYLLSTLYPFYMTAQISSNVLDQPNKPSRCTNTEIISSGNNSTTFLTILTISIILGTILCYLAMCAKLAWDYRQQQKGNAQTFQHQTRMVILKALAMIMGIQIGGWLVTLVVANALYFNATINAEQKAMISYLANLMSSICTDIEVPVLYLTSTDHRFAIRKQLIRLFGIFCQKQQNGGTINVIDINQNNNIIRVGPGSANANIPRIHSSTNNLQYS